MKNYIEIKIKKMYLVIGSIILLLGISFSGYYFWCANNPDIQIQISAGGTGKEGIKIEAPHISYTGRGIADPAASAELKLSRITMQHEFLCNYIINNYKESDIKLDMIVENNQTILKYYGTVTNQNNETEDFKRDIVLEFGLNADITDKS